MESRNVVLLWHGPGRLRFGRDEGDMVIYNWTKLLSKYHNESKDTLCVVSDHAMCP